MAQATQTLPQATPATAVQATFDKHKSASLYGDAWRRMIKNRGAILGLVVVAFFALLALFAPLFAPHNPQTIYPNNSLRPPFWVQVEGHPERSGDPSFILGTDTIGRDVLSRTIFGARTSLAVGFIPLFVVLLIGMSVGMAAGFFGGRIDNLLMRFTDIVYAFPDILFFIIMLTALRDTWIGQLFNGFVLLFVALALVSWVTVARLMRGQVLSVKERDYVEAARSIGASNWRLIIKHVLPNSLAPIIVAAAFIVPTSIIAEAILGYLGVGIRPTSDPNAAFPTSWGALLLDGKSALTTQPYILIGPAICVALIMLGFTFIGDGLRDALDPMMKGRV